MVTKARRSLHTIIGSNEVQLLTLKVHALLLGAHAASGTALGPRQIEVPITDSRGMAAALILMGNGLLVQMDCNRSSSFLKITDAGTEVVRRMVRSGLV